MIELYFHGKAVLSRPFVEESESRTRIRFSADRFFLKAVFFLWRFIIKVVASQTMSNKTMTPNRVITTAIKVEIPCGSFCDCALGTGATGASVATATNELATMLEITGLLVTGHGKRGGPNGAPGGGFRRQTLSIAQTAVAGSHRYSTLSQYS